MGQREMPEGMVYASPEYYRWYREKNKEKARAYAREYNKKRYVTHTEQERARRMRYREKNPIKIRAHELLNKALKAKRVIKTPCIECGASVSVVAHHDYYGRPLEVKWLCEVHHKERHKYLLSINHVSDPTIADLEELFRPRRKGRTKGINTPEKN